MRPVPSNTSVPGSATASTVRRVAVNAVESEKKFWFSPKPTAKSIVSPAPKVNSVLKVGEWLASTIPPKICTPSRST